MFVNKGAILLAAIISLSTSARAEEIFYGNRPVPVEIRGDTSTLLLLPAPPLSVSCQPANRIQFQAMDRASLTTIEAGYVSVTKGADEQQENPVLKRMLRAMPSDSKGTSDCSFNLSNARQVGVRFVIKNDITRPFVEFRPLSDRNANLTDPTRNLALEALKSSVGGDPIQIMREDKPFFGYSASASREKAKYKLSYRGGNGASLTLWKLEGVVRAETAAYDDLAVLSPQTGAVFYSALVPDQAEFHDGDHFVLHVVGSNSLTEEELLKALR